MDAVEVEGYLNKAFNLLASGQLSEYEADFILQLEDYSDEQLNRLSAKQKEFLQDIAEKDLRLQYVHNLIEEAMSEFRELNWFEKKFIRQLDKYSDEQLNRLTKKQLTLLEDIVFKDRDYN